jgi:hypothetical protein
VGGFWLSVRGGLCPKNDGVLKEQFVTAVTPAEAEARHAARTVDTEAPHAPMGFLELPKRAGPNLHHDTGPPAPYVPVPYSAAHTMFVRWQSRKRRRPQFGRFGKQLRGGRQWRDRTFAREGTSKQDVHWRAILVESVRVKGKPTQRHVAYLAGFTESAMVHPSQQCFLWERIEGQLDRLSNRMSREQRRAIEAALIKKIGKPPTKAQRKAVHRRRKEIFGDLA